MTSDSFKLYETQISASARQIKRSLLEGLFIPDKLIGYAGKRLENLTQ